MRPTRLHTSLTKSLSASLQPRASPEDVFNDKAPRRTISTELRAFGNILNQTVELRQCLMDCLRCRRNAILHQLQISRGAIRPLKLGKLRLEIDLICGGCRFAPSRNLDRERWFRVTWKFAQCFRSNFAWTCRPCAGNHPCASGSSLDGARTRLSSVPLPSHARVDAKKLTCFALVFLRS